MSNNAKHFISVKQILSLASFQEHLRTRKARKVIVSVMTLGALAAFAWMIASNWDSLRNFDWSLRLIPLFGSFFAYIIYVTLGATVWGLMVRAIGSPASWRQHFRSYIVGILINRLPLPFGHLIGRLMLYDESTSKKMLAFASSIELVFLAAAALNITLVLLPKSQASLDWCWKVFVLVLGFIAIHPFVLSKVMKRLKLDHASEFKYRMTVFWFFLFMAVWSTGGGSLFLLINSIYPLTLEYLPNVVGIWALSGLISILMLFIPVGFGLRELTLGILLAMVIPPGIAAIIALLSRVFFTFYELILGSFAYLVIRE